MRRRTLLPPRPRRPAREPVVPMINVVFLLLIFFLMTAQITPSAPFDLDLPRAAGEEEVGDAALYISAQGAIAFDRARGDAALAQAAEHGTGPLRLHADAALPAATLARILAQLTDLGASEVEIVTEAQ